MIGRVFGCDTDPLMTERATGIRRDQWRLPDIDENATSSQMARLIWDKLSRNPTRAVSDRLRIERWQLRAAIHKIKAANNLGATDRVFIYDDGSVTDENGQRLGNFHDET